MVRAVNAHLRALISRLPKRAYAYILFALYGSFHAISSGRGSVSDIAIGFGTIVGTVEITFRAVRILWRVYRAGIFVWAALAGGAATLVVRSLIGGVSDTLTEIILGAGLSTFTLLLWLFALLVYWSYRSEIDGPPRTDLSQS